LQREGYIRHVGLSEVTVADIEEAREYFDVATVQNMYNLIERKSEAVLEYCERHNIGFIPWFPLAAGDLAKPGSALSDIAQRLQATPPQIALAWILKRSRVMLPIPGTSKVEHLEENVAAASMKLTDDDFNELDRQAKTLSHA
jgi:aryl-alcohol dehydrogenase-like predicted oxidoreductase